MKAVSLIIQFTLFFTIGLVFFLLAGNLFRFQSDIIKRDIINSSSSLSLGQISAISIRAVNSCKSCDNTTIKIDQKLIAGYSPVYQLSNGVILKIELENTSVQSSVHNLNYSLTFDNSQVSSARTIALTYDRTKNNLVVK